MGLVLTAFISSLENILYKCLLIHIPAEFFIVELTVLKPSKSSYDLVVKCPYCLMGLNTWFRAMLLFGEDLDPGEMGHWILKIVAQTCFRIQSFHFVVCQDVSRQMLQAPSCT